MQGFHHQSFLTNTLNAIASDLESLDWEMTSYEVCNLPNFRYVKVQLFFKATGVSAVITRQIDQPLCEAVVSLIDIAKGKYPIDFGTYDQFCETFL